MNIPKYDTVVRSLAQDILHNGGPLPFELSPREVIQHCIESQGSSPPVDLSGYLSDWLDNCAKAQRQKINGFLEDILLGDISVSRVQEIHEIFVDCICAYVSAEVRRMAEHESRTMRLPFQER